MCPRRLRLLEGSQCVSHITRCFCHAWALWPFIGLVMVVVEWRREWGVCVSVCECVLYIEIAEGYVWCERCRREEDCVTSKWEGFGKWRLHVWWDYANTIFKRYSVVIVSNPRLQKLWIANRSVDPFVANQWLIEFAFLESFLYF